MDRHAALLALPTGYAAALALRDQGLDDPTIADRLGIAPEAIGSFLTLADAKLVRAQAQEDPDPTVVPERTAP